MTKIFFIVIVMLTGPKGTDLYVIEEPSFENPKQCVQFVQIYSYGLIQKAKSVYPNQEIENIYCVTKEKINEIMHGISA